MSRKISVNLEAEKDRLRLRWRFEKKQYCLYVGLEDTSSNRKKAGAIALQIEADIELGEFDATLAKYKPHPSHKKAIALLTCSELYADWLRFKSKFCDARTIEKLAYLLSPLARIEIPASALTRKDCLDFMQLLLDPCLKPETVRRKLENLAACWAWGIENNYVTVNPWIGLGKLIRSTPPPEIRPFTLDEVERIVSGFERSDRYSQLTPFVKFLFGTGTRTGEAIGLRWQNVAGDFSECLICEQVTLGKTKTTKTGKSRRLYLSTSMQDLLMELAEVSGSGLVFQWNDCPIDLKNFGRRIWKPILEGAGVPYRRVYNTRHTFISHALAQGLNPVDLAKLTGHNVQVLYQHYAGSIYDPRLPDLF